MAEDDFSASGLPASDQELAVNDEGKTAGVDLWHAHPKQQPAPPYHSLTTKIERRRPENATIRRWMELGDQVLNNEPEQNTTRNVRGPFLKNS
ncbi:MAG TPA: hypothetical protein VG498_08210 [Terriglobales bacterium]|nr:hypothetical protein [Terriglobales bacterium]